MTNKPKGIGDLTPQETLLSELQGEMPFDSEKDTVLVVEREGDQKVATKALIGMTLPNYRVQRVKNTPGAISDELFGRVAMIVDLSGGEGKENLFTHSSQGVNFARIPIITQPANPYEESDDLRSAALVEEREVDEALQNPTSFQCIDATVADAINKRLILFREINAIAQIGVLADYIEFMDSSVAEWSAKIREIEIQDEEMKKDIVSSISALSVLVEELKEQGPEIEITALREILHEINNRLGPATGFVSLLLDERDNLERQDVVLLQEFSKSLGIFINYTHTIQSACHHERTFVNWVDIADKKFDSVPEPQRLELPDGLNVCVLDDSSDVLQYCSRVITNAGGSYFEARNALALREYKKQFGDDCIDLILLDHNLNEDGTLTGDMLISVIRMLFPNAVIIAHTGDAERLKADPYSLYTSEGIEIVGKHQWNDVTRILKRKFEEDQKSE